MTLIEILKNLKTNEFLLHSNMPMDYTPGLPMLTVVNGTPYYVIPYLKFRMTGEVDRTRVFPPRFVVKVCATNGNIVVFQDISSYKRFEKINFQHPVGIFRHAAIRHFSKASYQQKRNELLALMDRLAASAEDKTKFSGLDNVKLCNLFALLLEPSLKPFYHAIEKDFFETYIQQEG